MLFMLKAINLQRLSLEQLEVANKKVLVLLGCSRPPLITVSGMDARTFYEEMLSQMGKELTPDGRVVDKGKE